MVLLNSFSPPTEGIRHEQLSTKLYINGKELGCGTLYITESNLSWRNNSDGNGLTLFYPNIALHGVTRDVENFGSECLFIHLNNCSEDFVENEEDESDSEDESRVTQMQFVPEDKSQLNAMYLAMTYCQELHPDPDQIQSEDEFEDAYSEEEEEEEEGGGGNVLLRNSFAGGDTHHLDGHNGLGVQINGLNIHGGGEEMETEGQFEDAEDD